MSDKTAQANLVMFCAFCGLLAAKIIAACFPEPMVGQEFARFVMGESIVGAAVGALVYRLLKEKEGRRNPTLSPFGKKHPRRVTAKRALAPRRTKSLQRPGY